MESKKLSRKPPKKAVETTKKTDKSLGLTSPSSSKKRPSGLAMALRHEGFSKIRC